MTHLIPPVVIAAIAGATSVVSDTIESHNVSIITAFGIAGAVGTGCLWVSHKFEERAVEAKEQALKVERALEAYNLALSQRLSMIEQKLKDLPCGETNGRKGEKCAW